jgi:uncharacterized RDD family membrane protein YckC
MQLLRTVQLRTPESIALDFTLAGIGNRAFAVTIDYTILSLGLALLAFIFSLNVEPLTEALTQVGIDAEAVLLWLAAIALIFVFAIYVGYFTIFETLWQGQTLGKRWVKIRVIQDNGRPVGLAQSALRTLLRPIDDLLYLGGLFITFGKQEKRIGDWVAGTLVIQEESSNVAAIALSPESQAVADQLKLGFNSNWLSPSELAVVVNFLQRRSQFSPKAKVQVSRQLVKQIQDRIGSEFLPENTSDEVLLEAIYRVFQNEAGDS